MKTVHAQLPTSILRLTVRLKVVDLTGHVMWNVSVCAATNGLDTDKCSRQCLPIVCTRPALLVAGCLAPAPLSTVRALVVYLSVRLSRCVVFETRHAAARSKRLRLGPTSRYFYPTPPQLNPSKFTRTRCLSLPACAAGVTPHVAPSSFVSPLLSPSISNYLQKALA